MNCWRVEGLLAPFLDGDLRGPEADAVAEHVEQCQACAERAAAIGALPPIVPPALPQESVEAVLEPFDRLLRARIAAAEVEEEAPRWSGALALARREVRVPVPMVATYLAVVGLLAGGVTLNHRRVQQLEASVQRREALIVALQGAASMPSDGVRGTGAIDANAWMDPSAPLLGQLRTVSTPVGVAGMPLGVRPVSYDGPRLLH